jgi:hypothetical protein
MFGIGCSQTPSRTSVETSTQSRQIKSLAILPLRNGGVIPDQSQALNRTVLQAFLRINPHITIVRPTESIALIERAGIDDTYGEFLRDFGRSGVPDVSTVRALGETLGADAILQGEIFNIQQVDGDYHGNVGLTSLTVRYSLVRTHDGIILWETVSNPKKATKTPFEPAPPLHQVISEAQDWIASSLPLLCR